MPSTPPALPIRSHRVRSVLLILIAILVIAAACCIMVMQYVPSSALNRISAHFLVPELKDAFFVYQQGSSSVIYHLQDGSYEQVSLGTTLPTTFMSRRGTHLASIQRGEQGRYEVRVDSTYLTGSTDLKTSAAASPDGTMAVYAQSSGADLAQAIAAHSTRFPSQVYLVGTASTTPKLLGTGFAPFFMSATTIAWFSEQGLMRYDLRTGSTTIMSADVHALPAPNPPPAVSPDGALIAWVSPDTAMVHIALVSLDTVREINTYPAKSTSMALGSDALYVIERTAQGGAAIWRTALASGSTPMRIHGLPRGGILTQLIP